MRRVRADRGVQRWYLRVGVYPPVNGDRRVGCAARWTAGSGRRRAISNSRYRRACLSCGNVIFCRRNFVLSTKLRCSSLGNPYGLVRPLFRYPRRSRPIKRVRTHYVFRLSNPSGKNWSCPIDWTERLLKYNIETTKTNDGFCWNFTEMI